MPPIRADRPPLKILDPEGPLLLCAPAVQHTPGVIEALHASLPALRGYMPWAHLEQTIDHQYTRMADVVAQYWKGADYIVHLYAPDAPQRMLGSVGLHRRAMNDAAVEIGYWVRSDAAGQGLCTRAARVMTLLAIEHLGALRVQCGYDVTNIASGRVAEKVGFEVEADLVGYGPAGTDAMRAAGWLGTGVNRMTALHPERARALPWYAPMKARLQWWDWRGEWVQPG